MDEAAFAALVERHRRELRVHCYRMTGSLEEAEDLVQETFLRAWRSVDRFEGRSSLRRWLYRIATNACLDALTARSRRPQSQPHPQRQPAAPGRVLPRHRTPPVAPGSPATQVAAPPPTEVAWLEPIPDHLWEPAAPGDEAPDAVVTTRETIELAFLAAIQHLAPRPRAVLILRDVLGWSARETATQLGVTVAAANNHLARARSTLREQLPERHGDWSPAGSSAEERAVLGRYMAAVEQGDLAAVAELLADDVRASMPPLPFWFRGRDDVVGALALSWDPALPHYVGRFRFLPVGANGQLGAAAYTRRPGDDVHRPFGVGVVTIADGRIVEMVSFHDPAVFASFDLPATLPPLSPGE